MARGILTELRRRERLGRPLRRRRSGIGGWKFLTDELLLLLGDEPGEVVVIVVFKEVEGVGRRHGRAAPEGPEAKPY